MYSKVALISCIIGLASAGALLNSGNHNQWENQGYAQGNYGAYNGYGNQGGYNGYAGYNNLEGHNAVGAGYGAQSGGAVSHVSITREITPSVPFSTGHGAHGLGYANHGLSANNGYAAGHGAAYNGWYGQGLGNAGAHGYGAAYNGAFGQGLTGAHGYAAAYNGAHGQSLGYANGAQGYGAYSGAHGYNHAVSTVSQHSIHKNPVTKHYGSHGAGGYSAAGHYAHPTSYSNIGYGSNGW